MRNCSIWDGRMRKGLARVSFIVIPNKSNKGSEANKGMVTKMTSINTLQAAVLHILTKYLLFDF